MYVRICQSAVSWIENIHVQFTWDEHKNQINTRKHKVSFELATRVFDDPKHYSAQDRQVEGEERWQTIGLVHGVMILLVAHTVEEEDQGETIRIISARAATPTERRQYEEAY